MSELISSELFEIASEVCWICGRTVVLNIEVVDVKLRRISGVKTIGGSCSSWQPSPVVFSGEPLQLLMLLEIVILESLVVS